MRFYLCYFDEFFDQCSPGTWVFDGANLTGYPVTQLHVEKGTVVIMSTYNKCFSLLTSLNLSMKASTFLRYGLFSGLKYHEKINTHFKTTLSRDHIT